MMPSDIPYFWPPSSKSEETHLIICVHGLDGRYPVTCLRLTIVACKELCVVSAISLCYLATSDCPCSSPIISVLYHVVMMSTFFPMEDPVLYYRELPRSEADPPLPRAGIAWPQV